MFGILVVEVDRTVDTAVEEAEVDTEVPFCRGLPLEVLVDDARGIETLIVVRAEGIVVRTVDTDHEVEVADTVVVTGLTVAGAEFDVVNPAYIAEEFFLADTPSERS